MEALEQQKKEKEAEKAAAAAAAVSNNVPYTPDYAAGLVSPAPAVSRINMSVSGIFVELSCSL